MMPAVPDPAGLEEFAARLDGGVKAAAARSRPANLDLDALAGWPGSSFAAVLAAIHGKPWVPAADPAAAVEQLTGELRVRRPLLISVLFSPGLVLGRLMNANPAPGTGLVDSWLALCWTAEAAWSAVTGGLPPGADYAAGDAELFRPLAARLRFLVLSEPFRWRGERAAAWWWTQREGRAGGEDRALGQVFGQESRHLLAARYGRRHAVPGGSPHRAAARGHRRRGGLLPADLRRDAGAARELGCDVAAPDAGRGRHHRAGQLPARRLAGEGDPARAGPAIAVLVLASFGYLVIEARNHGVAAGAALRRTFTVTVIGSVHALMVSLTGLVLVAPAFVGSGSRLTKLWNSPGYAQAGTELALATAWCLAVGVFSQILWDDRPITAPLAHLSWRNR